MSKRARTRRLKSETEIWLENRDRERQEATRRALAQRQLTAGFAPVRVPTLVEDLQALLDEHRPRPSIQLERGFIAIPRPRVGHTKTYGQGCRCAECRATNARKYAEWKARRRQLGTAIPERAHGTTGGYGNYGCRCMRCVEAQRAKNHLRVVERAPSQEASA